MGRARDRTICWLLLLAAQSVMANGALRYGFGAADAGAAGVFAGNSGDVLAGMQTNPATLATVEGGGLVLALRGAYGEGDYSKSGARYPLDASGVFPELAGAWRPSDWPVVFGVSAAPLAAQAAEWFYPDASGGIGGVSYGLLPHESSFTAYRVNAGLSWEVSETLAIGFSAGAVHAEVGFDAPFIFQTNPALAGAKVDLDLETDGWAPIVEFGALWRPDERWSVGLHARPQTVLELDGGATAEYSAQLPPLGLGGAPSAATYHASTKNALPWVVGGGLSWRATECVKLGMRVDWIGWESAFDDLAVALSGGDNLAINSAIGTSVSDRVPVGWSDSWVIGAVAEWRIDSAWTLRAGWRWAESPVPTALVTPLNAAILEHTLAIGCGWQRGPWRVDASYEYHLGGSEKVGVSGYRAGEYSNTKIDLSAHVFGLGLSRSF